MKPITITEMIVTSIILVAGWYLVFKWETKAKKEADRKKEIDRLLDLDEYEQKISYHLEYYGGGVSTRPPLKTKHIKKLDELIEEHGGIEEIVSNCCGSKIIYSDLCKSCKEHCGKVYIMEDGMVFDEDGEEIN